MLNRRWIIMLSASATTLIAADWREATGKLTPGQRVDIQHRDKIERGIYSLSNASEIVITKGDYGFLSIPQSEVDRVVARGSESPKLGYFMNARDQLFSKPEVVYERAGAPPAALKKQKKRLPWR